MKQECGHDIKYQFFHPALKGGDRYRCAACDDPKGVTKFMQENPLPIDKNKFEDLKKENYDLREMVRFFSSRYKPEISISRDFYEEEMAEKMQILLKKYHI